MSVRKATYLEFYDIDKRSGEFTTYQYKIGDVVMVCWRDDLDYFKATTGRIKSIGDDYLTLDTSCRYNAYSSDIPFDRIKDITRR
jgi:hypothetical protein